MGTCNQNSLTLIHTGSVASVKAIDLYRVAKNVGYHVTSIIVTKSAVPFYIESILRDIYKDDSEKYLESVSSYASMKSIGEEDLRKILMDQGGEFYENLQKTLSFGEENFSGYFGRGVRDIQHINKAKVTNILVAPASAHTLAQIYYGATDSFALEIIRAFNPDLGGKVFIAPAMNTHMLHDPAIVAIKKRFLGSNFNRKYKLLPTQEGLLACGEQGDGALLDSYNIFKEMQNTQYEL